MSIQMITKVPYEIEWLSTENVPVTYWQYIFSMTVPSCIEHCISDLTVSPMVSSIDRSFPITRPSESDGKSYSVRFCLSDAKSDARWSFKGLSRKAIGRCCERDEFVNSCQDSCFWFRYQESWFKMYLYASCNRTPVQVLDAYACGRELGVRCTWVEVTCLTLENIAKDLRRSLFSLERFPMETFWAASKLQVSCPFPKPSATDLRDRLIGALKLLRISWQLTWQICELPKEVLQIRRAANEHVLGLKVLDCNSWIESLGRHLQLLSEGGQTKSSGDWIHWISMWRSLEGSYYEVLITRFSLQGYHWEDLREKGRSSLLLRTDLDQTDPILIGL